MINVKGIFDCELRLFWNGIELKKQLIKSRGLPQREENHDKSNSNISIKKVQNSHLRNKTSR